MSFVKETQFNGFCFDTDGHRRVSVAWLVMHIHEFVSLHRDLDTPLEIEIFPFKLK